MSPSSSEELVARSASALLAEVAKQTDDAVTAGEVRDLAEALAALAPLLRGSGRLRGPRDGRINHTRNAHKHGGPND